MHLFVRGLAAPALALALVAGGPGLAQGQTRNVDIAVDDAADRFVGTGGLVLPATVAADTRREVANCTDCRWRLREPCAGVFAPGCIIILHACAGVDEQLLRAWLSHDGGASWQNRGLICVSSGGPVTVAATGVAIQDDFERVMPRGRITFQPGRGVLPYLPVIFHSGQPQSVPATTYQVAGQEVVLSPTPSWGWNFGDGTGLTTQLAGSTYPDRAVAHSYARGGRFQVVVTTTWSATFTVAGLGPFPVSEPVTQSAMAVVAVGQARGVLIP